MKFLAFISSLFLALSLTGCATLFGDHDKTVHVDSQPQGAQVFVNNMPVGVTPTTVAINNPLSPPTITLKKPGYETQLAQVNTNFQTIGILNIFFWPGFIVDALTGDMMKVAPESRVLNVPLIRSNARTAD